MLLFLWNSQDTEDIVLEVMCVSQQPNSAAANIDRDSHAQTSPPPLTVQSTAQCVLQRETSWLTSIPRFQPRFLGAFFDLLPLF